MAPQRALLSSRHGLSGAAAAGIAAVSETSIAPRSPTRIERQPNR
jgi:hypothetical protein